MSNRRSMLSTLNNGGGFSYLLDLYPGALVAYSLRQLISTYPSSSRCIRIRRSSDNAELDIYFVSNVVDTASILSFVGSGDGYVVRFCNQLDTSGVRDAYQSIALNQPLIVQAGVLCTQNGKPTIKYTSASQLLKASSTPLLDTYENTMVTLQKFNNVAGYKVVASAGDTGGDNIFCHIGWGRSSYGRTLYQLTTINEDGTTTLNQEIWVGRSSIISSTNSLYMNNVPQILSLPYVPFHTDSRSMLIGNDDYGSYIDGNVQEVVYYRSYLSNANASGVTLNLNNYYNVY